MVSLIFLVVYIQTQFKTLWIWEFTNDFFRFKMLVFLKWNECNEYYEYIVKLLTWSSF